MHPETPLIGTGQAVGESGILRRFDRLDDALRAIEREAEANYREHLALRERQDIILAEQRKLLSKLRAPIAEPRKWTICLDCGLMVGVWLDERDCDCDPALAGDAWVDVVEAKPHPPRNRGEAAAVDGLTAVGQEDAPNE